MTDYAELEGIFAREELHPADLKASVERYLNDLLEPIRAEFSTPELKKLASQAYPQPSKKKGGAAAAAEDGATDELVPSRLDLRIGKILAVDKHPDADSLYVETVDLGEAEPRTVVSGLAGLVPMEDLKDSVGVFMCNLKPVKMRGVESSAMLMCASREEPRAACPLAAPEGSVPGDRVFFDGHRDGQADEELKPKKKVWEKLQVDLRVNAEGGAEWQDCDMLTELGPILCPSLTQVPIK